MSKVLVFFLGILLGVGLILPFQAAVAEGSCFCATATKDSFSSLGGTVDPVIFDDQQKYDVACYEVDAVTCAAAGASNQIDDKYTDCKSLATPASCQAEVIDWKKAKDAAIQNILSAGRAQRTELHNKGVIERLLPACVFETKVSGDCRHINVFIKVGIDIADYVLSIVGALALVVFIYGGMLMIISEGHSDRVEKGKEAMVAALIGLVIIFAAYILVKFFAGVVGVQSGFNLQ